MRVARPPVEPSDMLARIIEEATCLFVARGYRGIAMREIAEAAGISKAGLYYHFKDKEELFLAILTANLETVAQIVQATCGEDASARQRVTHMLQALLTLPPNQRAIIRLANQEMVHISQAARSAFEGIYRVKFLGQVEAALQAGIAQGELRPVNVQLATWLLLGMAYPFFSPGHPSDGMNEVIDLMVSVFFDGLSCHAGDRGSG
jgi:AcrR family transcriptional regulator